MMLLSWGILFALLWLHRLKGDRWTKEPKRDMTLQDALQAKRALREELKADWDMQFYGGVPILERAILWGGNPTGRNPTHDWQRDYAGFLICGRCGCVAITVEGNGVCPGYRMATGK
jgi:GAF domain-containing protein